MISITIKLFGCLAVLFVTFVKGSINTEFSRNESPKSFHAENIDSVKNNVREQRSTDSIKELFHSKGAFLAGEDTPVWIAYYSNPKDRIVLTYKKLDKGIVKEAIDLWESDQYQRSVRKTHTTNENLDWLHADPKNLTKREVTNSSETSDPLSVIPLQKLDDTIVYHPSVLAITEYGDNWPSNERTQKPLILERIIYTLAFWNGVDLQFRPIRYPRVRIRLSGIIIGRDRDELNHVFEIYTDRKTYLNYEGTLYRLVEFWGNRAHQKLDFLPGSYNIVALMTNEKTPLWKRKIAISTNGPPCDHNNFGATGVLVAKDHLDFFGIQGAVSGIARILGHGLDNTSCNYRINWKNRAWKDCDLESIRQSIINNGWCMKEPLEYHPPGKPVKPILPGSLLTMHQQCRSNGWKEGYVCEKQSCDAIICRKDKSVWSSCVRRMAAPDGTVCGKGLICLNEKCLPNTTLSYD